MRLFTGHKIIKDGDGYIVVLYLERHLTEFAREFNEMCGYENKNLKISVIDYIKEKFPKQKVNQVNVMLGSLQVVTLSFGNSDTTLQDCGG